MKKNILITGGNSGIGYATAKKFIENGYTTYILGRNQQKTQQAASDLGAEAVIADMESTTDFQSIASLFKDTGLDALVNNAGIAQPAPFENCDENIFAKHFNTNIRGPFFLIKSLLPALEKQRGAVTNISSIITTRGANSGFTVYAATKGALEVFTRNLAKELAPKNIRVNAICPGAIDTPIFNKVNIPPDQIPKLKENVLATIPLNRLGDPEEIADVVYNQINATYVTGSIWSVDGGVST